MVDTFQTIINNNCYNSCITFSNLIVCKLFVNSGYIEASINYLLSNIFVKYFSIIKKKKRHQIIQIRKPRSIKVKLNANTPICIAVYYEHENYSL